MSMETGGSNLIETKACDGGVEAVIRHDPIDLHSLRKRLKAVDGLVRVSLMQPVSELKDLSFIAGIQTIRRLHLNSLPKETDYSSLETLPLLREITTGNRCWFNCNILPKLTNLGIFRSGPNATNIQEIRQCKSLEWVELGGAKSHNFSFVAGLGNLNRLRLWGCKINYSEGLDQCHSLSRLDLGESTISEINCLMELPQLNILQLESCKKIIDSSPIKYCPSLKQLDVSHCRFMLDWEIISLLTNLEIFKAVGMELGNDECQALVSLPRIKKISVSRKYGKILASIAEGIEIHSY